MQAAAERARAAGDLPSLARALVNISDALFELGRYDESAAAAAEGVPTRDRVGVSRTTGVFLLANHAEALIALGRWDEADARLRRGGPAGPARHAGAALAAAARPAAAGPRPRGRRARWSPGPSASSAGRSCTGRTGCPCSELRILVALAGR